MRKRKEIGRNVLSDVAWRRRAYTLAIGVYLIQATAAFAGNINVFLVGGQSNADGRGDSAELPEALKSQTNVIYYSNTAGAKLTHLQPWTSPSGGIYQFGPEITFGRDIADFYAGTQEKVALVKFARGGTNLFENWRADGTADSTVDGKVYQDFQAAVKRGLSQIKAQYPDDTIVIRGMIWMQGEGDTETKRNEAENGKYSLEYAKNLTDFIRDIRATYGPDIHFVIGRLSDSQKGTGPDIYRNNVRACQDQVAKNDAAVGLVNTDGFAVKPDRVHFNAAGQQALGSGFAKEMQRLLQQGSSRR